MISKRFVIKRLLLLIPVLFGVATFVFAILQLSPGDPARVVAGQRASEAFVQQVRHEMGLDQPIWVQYGDFLWNALHLDLGQSYQIRKGVPVTQILTHRLPVTVEMALYGQIFGILFGIPLGVISAIKQDSATDHLTRIGALTGISIPIYWSGPLLILLFAQYLHLFPPSGRIASEYSINLVTGLITVDTLLNGNFAAFQSAVMHLFLPALVIGIYSMALISRMMRSSMLEVVRQDYIRTARAKGQGTKITMLKHGFRNALIPVVTVIGIQFGTLLGGAVLTETVFGIPGIGTMLVDAIEVGDFPVVQGTVLTFALLFTLVNLFVDITYSYLDPRIQQ
ncbi:binding-protein-dependent transport systems inner membrane component [Haladaptatus paucihalophilus DX253]|uniref:Binding-protein-dependent transport systems inner membrane component n=1 Tax=Haladaptatus paucihalophilus DX253 TaxID=797209 RepID=E7QUE1_HALPU|nr:MULTISPECIES: ABC transporter permease [Haladaptatus]EFW92220.1 binding-protein-dependent transport systems inner membrane component [Haladaptatus paucihalophilus DX253]ODR83109.1 peptide ABC transporter permease [Haladaptatus sp. W1]GKZ14368.1 peptide ABC transporter permease [Haladaptatus sp. T7]SHK92175.1 peptide/nickel transport system permease protein [Haladaptatus paucihalophilus DX253]